MPYADKEKQKEYMRKYAQRDRAALKNIEVSGKLKRGDHVRVHNKTLSGADIDEGEAVLKQKMLPEKYAEFWRVEFPDGSNVLRWVRAEDKVEP